MKIGIGIDTGGTYTDAVAFDFDNDKVMATAKALTTYEDLTIGILNALDALPVDLVQQAVVLSMSTTLATNACVQNRGGRARLVFIGGSPSSIDERGGEYGLPGSEEIVFPELVAELSDELRHVIDLEKFDREIEENFAGLDGAGVVEMYAAWNGNGNEDTIRKLIAERLDIPVVCGHELFDDLNTLKRGASTLLNARLFPVIKEFIAAIKSAMAARNLTMPMVIMRSDGSLMNEAFTLVRPVETLLCGPAASVMGAVRLADETNCVAVDMGGTTTDIALVRDGDPVLAGGGVTVGKWQTFVKGLYVHTLGLGGDTAIHYAGDAVVLEDYRVVPLCVVASRYPSVLENLRTLAEKPHKHSEYLHEHYLLTRDIADSLYHTKEEKKFCAALKAGPLILADAAKAAECDIYSFDVAPLVREGVVQVCGLTTTDIMHIQGDYTGFSTEAAQCGAIFVAANLEITVQELCEKVYDMIKRRLYLNIVKVLMENSEEFSAYKSIGEETEAFINACYDLSSSEREGLLSARITTKMTLLGIGAPIHLFLPDVAEKLGTKAVVPKHAGVANALGAVVGQVSTAHTIEIRPDYTIDGLAGYIVYGAKVSKPIRELADAVEMAKQEAVSRAKEEAVSRGAVGEITIECDVKEETAEARDTTVYLGSRVVAKAVGYMGF